MSGFSDFGKFDALGLAELVRNKDVTADELLDESIDRLERVNGDLNAVVIKCYDEAKKQIADGLPDGPFTGVPYLLKDLHLQLEGTETSSGSNFFKGSVADHDSTLVERYKQAGLTLYGKTNSPELGLTCTTEPKAHGPTRNPWNLNHSTGGSSGGAGAIVAARATPMANASDGGGSIRIPAAACGLYGHKPTRASTPFGPDRGEGWNGASISHAVTLTVRDSAALLDATMGMAPGDPYPPPPHVRPYLEECSREPGRLKIGFNTKCANGSETDAECIKAVEDAAKLCADLGHIVEETQPVHDAAALGKAQIVILSSHSANALQMHAEATGRTLSQEDVEKVTWFMVEASRGWSAVDFANAQVVQHQQARIVANLYEDFDVIIEPVMGVPPIELGQLNMDSDDLATYNSIISRVAGFTGIYNMTGQPSTNIPLHWSANGLPVGTMFTAKYGRDDILFRLAAQIEKAKPWFDKVPPLHA